MLGYTKAMSQKEPNETMKPIHTLHIPVMGTGFSIDTPIKVAKYGISSVISLVDDTLIEEMRKYYCGVMGEAYTPITKYDEDYRARRITAYLNLVDRIVKMKFEEVRNSCFEMGSEITKYFELLPNSSPLRVLYLKMLEIKDLGAKKELQERLREMMRPGDINVNIMTKLDRTNYDSKGTELPMEYSDALAALRGYAQSTLNSAIVFSAGINRRLYSYIEKFRDFYADATGAIKKRIILKVSDYRSSIIQGKFLAKKGLWISEFRVESGLNCGGHAFASDGFLLGPILEEFKKKRDELIKNLHEIYNQALKEKNEPVFETPHQVLITAQGGIGTAKENNFLTDYYELDGTGWGTPFLLCPEATNVDKETLQKLSDATENDVHLSDVSPLGVPFHNLKLSPSEEEKLRKISVGKPGSACPKGHLVSNTEFTKEPICTASRQYQKLKIDQLGQAQLPKEEFQVQYNNIVKKSCICNELGHAPLINNGIDDRGAKRFTAICPGPNIAYFSKIVTLKEMMDHVYGRADILGNVVRPNMFIKELKLYVDYFIKEVKKISSSASPSQVVYLNEFKKNLKEGIEYYRGLFPTMLQESENYRQKILEDLDYFSRELNEFILQYKNLLGEKPAEIPATI